MGLGGRVSIYPEKKLLITNPFGQGTSNDDTNHNNKKNHIIAIPIDDELGGAKEESPMIEVNGMPEDCDENDGDIMQECRICQVEDVVSKMETPCGCSGTLMYAHRSCIQQWCNVKGSLRCEVCMQLYFPEYTLKVIPFDDDEEVVMMSSEPGFIIPGTNTRIYTPLELITMVCDRISRSMNRDLDLKNLSPGVVFGLALLIFMAVMIIRDAYNYAPPREDKFNHTLFCIIMIIAVPVYVLQWIFLCQAHRERERRDREREREMQRDNSA